MAGIKVRGRYCIQLPGLLKWIQMVFACIVLGLILFEIVKDKDFDKIKEATKKAASTDDSVEQGHIIKGEQYTIVVGFFCIVVNFIFLFIFFLNCHNGPCVGCSCFSFASFYYGFSFFMWLAAAGVEVYATITYRDWSEAFFTVDKGYYAEMYRRRAAAAAFCFANALTYLVSLQQAKYQDL